MRKKPLGIVLASFGFATVPALSLWWHEPLTPIGFLLDWVFPLLLALGLFVVSRTSWYVLFGLLAVYGFRDLYQQFVLQGLPPGMFFGNVFGYLLTVFYFINPRIQRLYFDHRLHWWRAEMRRPIEIPVLLKSREGYRYGVLVNLSSRGCFAKFSAVLSKDEIYAMRFVLPEGLEERFLEARAVIRWEKQQEGYGFEFVGANSQAVYRVQRVVSYLRKHHASSGRRLLRA